MIIKPVAEGVLIALAATCLVLILGRCCAPEPEPIAPAVYVSTEDLERIEARLLWSHATVRRWEDLAERRRQAESVFCEDLRWHAERRKDARQWARR